MAERPHWQPEAQKLVSHWGTRHPLTLREIVDLPIYDLTGRPVVEDVEDIPNIANVPNENITVTFSDRRWGRLANSSAYKTVMSTFDETLQMLSAIRLSFFPADKKLSEDEMMEVMDTAVILARWFILKADNPIENGMIPPVIGSVARIGRGLAKPLGTQLAGRRISEFSGIPYPALPLIESAEAYLDNIVDQDELLGTEKACPAPLRVIEQTIKAVFEPSIDPEEAKEILGLSDEEIERVRKLSRANNIANIEQQFLVVTQHAIKVGFDKEMDEIKRGGSGARERESGLALVSYASPQEKIAKAHESLGKKVAVVAANSAARLDIAQKLANEALGRNDPSPFTAEDLISTENP